MEVCDAGDGQVTSGCRSLRVNTQKNLSNSNDEETTNYFHLLLEWLSRGKDYGVKALDVFKDTVLSEFKGLASDIGGEISAIGNYDTKDVKGLLDNVDKDKIKSLVEKVKPLIPEYYEKARKMATDIFNQGKKEFDKIREEVENEVTSPF